MLKIKPKKTRTFLTVMILWPLKNFKKKLTKKTKSLKNRKLSLWKTWKIRRLS